MNKPALNLGNLRDWPTITLRTIVDGTVEMDSYDSDDRPASRRFATAALQTRLVNAVVAQLGYAVEPSETRATGHLVVLTLDGRVVTDQDGRPYTEHTDPVTNAGAALTKLAGEVEGEVDRLVDRAISPGDDEQLRREHPREL